VVLLLEAKAAVDVRKGNGWTPLMYAAKSGSGQVVELLVAHKADVEARNKEASTALTLATREGQSGVVSQLAAAKADVRVLACHVNHARACLPACLPACLRIIRVRKMFHA
jgi:ankyrin repeat protein